MDITLLTCIYNTPYLISPLFKSFNKHHKNYKTFVVNSSDESDVSNECSSILKEFDIDTVINIPGASHGNAVNNALNLIDTPHLLLVDSDIIFYKGFDTILERMIDGDFVLGGEMVGDRGGKKLHNRIQPWYCYMNLSYLKNNGIVFFDYERTEQSKKNGSRIYDIGSTMFEDIINFGGRIANFNVENNYFQHYEGMSWHSQKFNPTDIDTDIDFGGTHPYKILHQIGLQTRDRYLEDTRNI